MHKYVFLESEVTNFFDLNDESQFIYLCCVKTDDYFHVLDTFEEYIKSADISIGNLETSFAGKSVRI